MTDKTLEREAITFADEYCNSHRGRLCKDYSHHIAVTESYLAALQSREAKMAELRAEIAELKKENNAVFLLGFDSGYQEREDEEE